jgi:hypothetical protein
MDAGFNFGTQFFETTLKKTAESQRPAAAKRKRKIKR